MTEKRTSLVLSIVFVVVWLSFFLAFSEDPLDQFRNHGALVLLGLLGALVGNATAVGGGIVFVPYMLLFYELDPLSSLKLALMTQAFGMSSGAIAWWRKGAVMSDLLRWAGPAVLSGVVLGTVVRAPAPGEVKLVFSVVSIGIGVLVLVLIGQKTVATEVPKGAALGLVVTTFVGTLITSWAAIGVGELVAAWLILRWRVLPERAIATGVVLLAVASVALALSHQLLLGEIPWHLTGFVVLGAVFGAQLGPMVARFLPSTMLKIVFAIVAILDGVILLSSSVG